jgi:hypothetical protein
MLLPALFGIGWGLAELVRRSGFNGFIFGFEFHKREEQQLSSDVDLAKSSRSIVRSRHD